MKNLLKTIILTTVMASYSQSDSEIYLLDIETLADGRYNISNPRNISNNLGYDNQPSFYDKNNLLFSSTRDGQTDLVKYNMTSGEKYWLTDTSMGSEYSPLRIPSSNDISSIRLDTNGLQRLYRYDSGTGKSELILKDAKVGYHVWYSKDNLVHTNLIVNRMDLILSDLKAKTSVTLQENVGRSLLKIPNTELISFISIDKDGYSVKSVHPVTKQIEVLSKLPKGTVDICWLPNGSMLFASGARMFILDLKTKDKPQLINLSDYKELGAVSRMAVSPNGKILALVAEKPPSKIVQEQVNSYNAGDLDAFVNCYSKNVVVTNFPNDTLYVGHKNMRENYKGLSPNNRTYEVEVEKRIHIGNKVIDQEKVTGHGRTSTQVAVYEVGNDSIQSMRFIFDDRESENPESIVQRQMEAYNVRDINAFLNAYSDGIEVYNFPNELLYTGKQKMREGYATFFDSTPDLNYVVKNRMVVRNVVIDEECITANGNNLSAVAIYEVENGKISKVTFMR